MFIILNRCFCKYKDKGSKTVRQIKGFTMIETIITLIIVAVISIVAVNVHANFSKKAKMSEGHALIGSISSAERMVYAGKGSFLPVNKSSYNELLDIDARSNKYYRYFYVLTPGADYNADYTIVAVSDDKSIKEYAVVLHGYINGSNISEVVNISDTGNKISQAIEKNSVSDNASSNKNSSVNYFYGDIDKDNENNSNY